MGHIHTEPGQHDYTVGAYVVRFYKDGPKILLHMHRKMGKLMPIGGHIELNETPWQAVAREMREESGYTLGELSIFQPFDRLDYLSDVIAHPSPLIMSDQDVSVEHFHTDTAYAFITTADPQENADEGESTDLRWLTQSELSALTMDEVFTNTKEVCSFIFNVCIKKWDQVPTGHYKI